MIGWVVGKNRAGLLELLEGALDAHLAHEPRDDGRIVLVKLGVGVAHGAGEAAKNLLIGEGVAERLLQLGLGGEGEVEVARDQVVEFQERRRRQHVVGIVGGVGLEDVDDHGEQVLTHQRAAEPRLLRA